MEATKENELLESLTLELRRGTIILGVLSQLKTPQYGYSLVVLLQEKGMNVDASTLYPLLRRLEKQEILISTWNTDGSKPRKYYEMSDLGKSLYIKLCDIWREINSTMNNLIKN
ncbi:MAG: PadR family transcriptional regulator [Clostridium sp.]